MKKKILIGTSLVISHIIIATVAGALSVRQFTADETNFIIKFNEERCLFNNPIVTIEDNTYVPLRELCNELGYSVNWNAENKIISISEDNNTVFKDDVTTSRTGKLSNGREYVFYGTDQEDFSIDEFVEGLELVDVSTYTIKTKRETIDEMAEKVQLLLGLKNVLPERARIMIYYDKTRNELMFRDDWYNTYLCGGMRVITVQCDTGITTQYGSLYL